MNKKLRRKSANKPYRKIFILSTEGKITEPDYFSMFDNDNIHIKIVKGKSKKTRKSSPDSVLQRMSEYLEEEKLKKEKSDQYWLVIDKDMWLDSQIQPLYAWASEAKNRGFALSNPKFEYWLLLHFEDGKGIRSPRELLDHLNKYLPGYAKHLNDTMLEKLDASFQEAIKNAKQKDVPACEDWPKIYGTTVYRLVEEILKINLQQKKN